MRELKIQWSDVRGIPQVSGLQDSLDEACRGELCVVLLGFGADWVFNIPMKYWKKKTNSIF